MPFGFSKSRQTARQRTRHRLNLGGPMALERRDLMAVLSLLNGIDVGPDARSIDGFPTPPPPPLVVPPTALGVQFTTTTNLTNAGLDVEVVGDVNGDGFDDFLVSAPQTTASTFPDTTAGTSGIVYLVFGSRSVDPNQDPANFRGLVNFLGDDSANPPILPRNERVADLAQLGNILQTSPLTGGPTFPFDGLTFVTGLSQSDEFGAAVARLGDINGDGLADFMIGAPGANSNAGRGYIVYGSPQLDEIATGLATIDFDRPIDINPAVRFTVIENNFLPGARFGRSMAGVGDVIADTFSDFAVGAPDADVGVGLIDNGAVFLFSSLPFRGTTPPTLVNLAGFGGVGDNRGILFVGGATGSGAGFSVAQAGNFDGVAGGELLIGAPSSPGAAALNEGRAYVIYGASNLLNQFTTLGVAPIVSLNALNLVVNDTLVEGVTFAGDAAGDQTGFAVSTAGNYNGSGPDDILIGSPGFGPETGRATVVAGAARPAAGARDLPLTGLDPAIFPSASFVGINPGDLAGFAVGAVRSLNNDQLPEILIGSPGFANNSGAMYLVAGTSQPVPAVVNLVDVAADAAGVPPGIQFVLQRGPGFLGTSVSGVSPFSARNLTVDSDPLGDFLIGAPFDDPGYPTPAFGGAFLLEGAFVPLATPAPGPPGPPPPPPPGPPIFGPALPTARFAFPAANAAAPQYGESLVPTPQSLSGLSFYKPLPLIPETFRQFQARPGFAQRFRNFYHPDDAVDRPFASSSKKHSDGIFTLPRRVFTRGRYEVGEIPGRINHRAATIPLAEFRSVNRGLVPNRALHTLRRR